MINKITDIFRSIKDNNAVSYIELMVFCTFIFSLPFGKSFFLPILFIWYCLTFLTYLFYKDYHLSRLKGILFFPILFWVLHLMGFISSTNIENVGFDIQVKISILLFPLLFPYHRKIYSENKTNILWMFVFGSIAASIFYLGNASYHSLYNLNGHLIFNPIPIDRSWCNYFLGTDLSWLTHPSYLALYFSFSIVVIISNIVTVWKRKLIFKIGMILSILILVLMIVLLQSRAALIGLIFLFIIIIVKEIIVKNKRYFVGIFVFSLLILFSTFIIQKFERFNVVRGSIQTTLKDGINSQNKEDGTAIRLWIWKSSIELIKENPILGVGSGDVKEELKKKYEKFDMPFSASQKYNCHNQFLETWLSVGFFGFLSLLLMLFGALYSGIKNRDFKLVYFILLVCISFCFESMLNTIAGVAFFAVFYTLLVTNQSSQEENIKSEKELKNSI